MAESGVTTRCVAIERQVDPPKKRYNTIPVCCVAEYAEPSLTRGGSLCVRRSRAPWPDGAKFGEIWRNFERDTVHARTEGFPGYKPTHLALLMHII